MRRARVAPDVVRGVLEGQPAAVEQNAEVDWADEEDVELLLKEAAPAAEIEAFSHKADALGSDRDSVV